MEREIIIQLIVTSRLHGVGLIFGFVLGPIFLFDFRLPFCQGRRMSQLMMFPGGSRVFGIVLMLFGPCRLAVRLHGGTALGRKYES